MKKKAIIAIASLLTFGQGAWAQTTSFTETDDEKGTEAKPFLIESIDDLNALAADVNSGNDYSGVYFKLTAPLNYSGKTFTPIGMGEESGLVDTPFKGIFDGDNKTISNITYTDNAGVGVGLFGYIFSPAEIRNVSLANCSFTGNSGVGAIVGNSSGSSQDFGIYDCTVASSVFVTATTDDEENAPAVFAGGIIGYCGNLLVSNCTSAASVSGGSCVGGIAGILYEGTIENCFYTGNSDFSDESKGVITGDRGDPDNDGYEGTIKLTLYNDDSDAIKNATHLSYYNGVEDVDVTLSGRTLFKDGKWNTLCLPFNVSTSTGLLSGNNVSAMTLNTSSSNLNGNTLTLNFSETTSITAGTPFIIKWDNTGAELTDLKFTGVTIKEATNNTSVGEDVTFTGAYTPVVIGAGGDNTKLYLGGGNTLYYPNAAMTIGAFRAYFQLNGITAGAPAAARTYVLNFGDASEQTGIVSVSKESGSEGVSAAWYSLDGQRLGAQPTKRSAEGRLLPQGRKKGLYIVNGRKVVIK